MLTHLVAFFLHIHTFAPTHTIACCSDCPRCTPRTRGTPRPPHTDTAPHICALPHLAPYPHTAPPSILVDYWFIVIVPCPRALLHITLPLLLFLPPATRYIALLPPVTLPLLLPPTPTPHLHALLHTRLTITDNHHERFALLPAGCTVRLPIPPGVTTLNATLRIITR